MRMLCSMRHEYLNEPREYVILDGVLIWYPISGTQLHRIAAYNLKIICTAVKDGSDCKYAC